MTFTNRSVAQFVASFPRDVEVVVYERDGSATTATVRLYIQHDALADQVRKALASSMKASKDGALKIRVVRSERKAPHV